MKNAVLSYARRILKALNNYHELGDESQSFPYLREITLQKPEKFIGVYENWPGERNESIVITNIGLHAFCKESWTLIKYEDITNVELASAKATAEVIKLYLTSGEKLELPVRGGGEKFRDIFEFARFLERVLAAVRSSNLVATS